MQPFAVIEADDVGGDVRFGLGVIGIFPLPDALHLEIEEEAFGHCVVPAISCAAHATHEAMLAQ